MFQLNVFCRRQKAVSLPSPSPRVAPPMDVRPLWGRTREVGIALPRVRSEPADRVFPIHSAPRGSNNCTHRDRTAVDVRPLWGRTREVGGVLFRGFAMLTRGYRIVRPPWGRIPARHIVVPWVASRTAGTSSCRGAASRTACTSSCRGAAFRTASPGRRPRRGRTTL